MVTPDDTTAARQLAALLPLELTLPDPRTGVLCSWPSSGTLAVVHDDPGSTVPAPGFVRLGTVDAGLDAIASAANRFTVRMGGDRSPQGTTSAPRR